MKHLPTEIPDEVDLGGTELHQNRQCLVNRHINMQDNKISGFRGTFRKPQ